MHTSGTDCSLARESVSADLDGELSELDNHRLQAHLRVCADCATWSALVAATTTQLRDAPLATPAAPVELPRRGRTWRTAPALAVAPGLALVASIVFSLGGAQHRAGAARTPHQRSIDRNGPAVGMYAPDAHHRVFHAV